VAQPLDADLEPDFDRPDIARLDDHVAERQHAVLVPLILVDGAVADPDETGTRVDHRVDRHHFVFDGRGRRHDFERRTGLVEILYGAVPPIGLACLPINVGVERRLVGHRQNLAGSRIHDDGRASLGPVRGDARTQLALRDVL
jgi:hypothetical protein